MSRSMLATRELNRSGSRGPAPTGMKSWPMSASEGRTSMSPECGGGFGRNRMLSGGFQGDERMAIASGRGPALPVLDGCLRKRVSDWPAISVSMDERRINAAEKTSKLKSQAPGRLEARPLADGAEASSREPMLTFRPLARAVSGMPPRSDSESHSLSDLVSLRTASCARADHTTQSTPPLTECVGISNARKLVR